MNTVIGYNQYSQCVSQQMDFSRASDNFLLKVNVKDISRHHSETTSKRCTKDICIVRLYPIDPIDRLLIYITTFKAEWHNSSIDEGPIGPCIARLLQNKVCDLCIAQYMWYKIRFQKKNRKFKRIFKVKKGISLTLKCVLHIIYVRRTGINSIVYFDTSFK